MKNTLLWPTRRSFLAAMAITPSIRLSAFAQEMPQLEDTIATDAGNLLVHPIHHAALTLTGDGMTILVDPAPAPGAAEGSDVTAEYKSMPPASLVLVTHEHGDHFNVDILAALAGDAPIVVPQAVADKMPDDLKARAVVIANGNTGTVAGVAIEAVPAYNITADRLKFHPKERHDNGYVLSLGGKRIYVAGDTEDTPEMRALSSIDVAFLPMNLPYTMDINQAADAVKAFKPGIIYPYHYGESDVNQFKTLVGDASDVRLLKWY